MMVGKSDVSTIEAVQDRRPWQSPELRSVGTLSAILQGGGGKLTPSPNDPGEVFKPKGQG
jgi:hypothetical protein